MTRIWCCVFFALFGFATSVYLTCDDCSCNQNVVNCVKVCDVCKCENGTINCELLKLNASFPANQDYWPMGTAHLTLLLGHNLIGHVVPFPDLLIETMELSFNTIVTIEKQAFYNLTNLKVLDLSHNQLTRISLDPDVFMGPYDETSYEPLNIVDLDLGHNELIGLNPDVFMHLPKLERLNLESNDFGASLDRSTTVAICSATNLQVLNLRNVGLATLPDTFLKNLGNLQELILSENLFTQVPVAPLSYGPSLKILHLDDNPIKAITTNQPFPSLPNLQQLHISFMPLLKRIEADSLAKLTALSYLNCKDNELLEFISEDALKTKQMTKMDLNDNALRYLSHKLIKRWDQVELDIRGNQWQCDCENQWLLDTLMDLPNVHSDGLTCAGPEPMKGKIMEQLHSRNYEMRCLDYYGNHPEFDASYLAAFFALIVIVMVAGGALCWYRGGRCRKGKPIDYSAIYHRDVDNDFDKF